MAPPSIAPQTMLCLGKSLEQVDNTQKFCSIAIIVYRLSSSSSLLRQGVRTDREGPSLLRQGVRTDRVGRQVPF